ncbi:hypothetical protein [Lentzea flava]|uniref:DNA topoisomerase (ATP-hydrolyzing) n=1 Tax=Lentzea flava TaxID=103732 RepID=A0ABQ2UXP6_9PSEU|nr:hypothetical protein [Lentzea flava]MCP2202130.1 DNA gyrase/topoisomerase IV, subunit A [Lentzea flava]GGU57208.1 hypothetical protein GCM10010178_57030 [Lentzea flava]
MTYPPGYAEERIQILSAVCRAADSYAEIAGIIATSANEDVALAALRERLGTTEPGARAVLEMQFRRLMPGHRERLRSELEEWRSQVERDR